MVKDSQQEKGDDALDETVVAEQGQTAANPETDEKTEQAAPELNADQLAELAAADAGEAAGDIAEAELTVEHLLEELEAAREASLRAQAEAQNARRRAEQEVEKARKFALERFTGELLPVVDNLERAMESSVAGGDEVKAITDGVDLTLKGLLDALKKFNVEQIDPAGEPFDPQMHQAMSMVESADAEPNSVLHVMQKGYTLSGRLIRPAMVMVSKAVEGKD